jgi:hypothetical protein
MQRRYDLDSLPWHLVEVPPGAGTQLRRWNVVILPILGLLSQNSSAAAASQARHHRAKKVIQPPRGS